MNVLLLLLAIASPALSVVINCNFEEVNWNDGNRYTCTILQVFNQDKDEVTLTVGEHLPSETHNDVKAFSSTIRDAFLTFPKDLDKDFPSLEAIRIRNSALTSISSTDLAPWPNLVYFSAANNKIKTLDGNLFDHSPKLQRIIFFNNLIQRVEDNLLSNLNELIYVDFVGNLCIDFVAETPEQIESLKTQLIRQCRRPQQLIMQGPRTQQQ